MVKRRKLTQQEIDRFYLWLHEYPGYKQIIRERISEEQKRRRKLDWRFTTRERALWKRYHPGEPYPGRLGQLEASGHVDVDKLGREVEGCG